MTTESETTTTIDRAAVMAEARRQYAVMRPLAGWTFAKALSYAWGKAKRKAALAASARDSEGA
jgi:hypothetical protein